jgi:hypothetical protein
VQNWLALSLILSPNKALTALKIIRNRISSKMITNQGSILF